MRLPVCETYLWCPLLNRKTILQCNLFFKLFAYDLCLWNLRPAHFHITKMFFNIVNMQPFTFSSLNIFDVQFSIYTNSQESSIFSLWYNGFLKIIYWKISLLSSVHSVTCVIHLSPHSQMNVVANSSFYFPDIFICFWTNTP
jgi:hypothetical protein